MTVTCAMCGLEFTPRNAKRRTQDGSADLTRGRS